MYGDSGLFLRGASGVGFAARRMDRRMEQGVRAPGAWRSHTGAVLRLLPDRLAGLAAEVRAAAHPSHPAAADPERAVREHVGELARAARPAGTVADRASGRTLHVFRAPGRVREMEIVAAPTRGTVFDIVAVRPVGGDREEAEIYQSGAQNDHIHGLRVRGPRVIITWTAEQLGAFVQNPQNFPDAVYVLALEDARWDDPYHPNLFPLHRPRYVGQTAELAQRWAAEAGLIAALGGNPQAPFAVWIGQVQPDPGPGQQLQYFLHPNVNPNQLTPVQLQAREMELLRRDTEHVLIRSINAEIQAFTPANPQVNPHMLPLTNRSSANPIIAAPGAQGVDPGGIRVTHVMGGNMIQPWFLNPAGIVVAPGGPL